MQLTFAELANASPSSYSVISWPSDRTGTLTDQAGALIRTAERFAESVHVPLIGAHLGVASSRPEHFVLARLLACHGANVHFFCPIPVVWNAGHASLFKAAVDILEHYHEHLECESLRRVDADHLTDGEHFTITSALPGGANHPLAGRCAHVFAHDMLGENSATAQQALRAFGTLLRRGGTLDLFGSGIPHAGDLLDRLLQQCSLIGLGAQAACAVPQANGWRLSLQSLGTAPREYPSEDEEPLVMAHCQVRLHYAAHFAAGADILEAGCGTGLGARLFRTAGAASVLGLDYSPDVLERARSRTQDDRIEYRTWDLNQTPLPFPDGRFDLVVCLELLEHVREQAALVAEFHRVLKPGGRVILSVPDRAYEEASAGFNGYRNAYHVAVPTRADLERLLAGFDRVQYARQIEFLGSCVVEDNGALSGDFREQCPGPERTTIQTILAAGIKPPAEAARPVPLFRPHLRVFENALAWQLSVKQHVQNLERALTRELAERWAERNRSASRIARLMDHGPLSNKPWQKDLVHVWFRGIEGAYAIDDVYPGEWMQRFEELLASRWERSADAWQHPPSDWELVWTQGGRFLRVGVSNPPCVKTVLFPRPETEIGIGALWRWKRRGAQTVWFHEANGWKQYDLPSYLIWRATRWVGRRIPGLKHLMNFTPPGPNDALLRWTMRLSNRSRPAAVSFPSSGEPCHAAWRDHIAAIEPVSSEAGQQLKVLHYTGGLYPGGAERQLCNLALSQKRRGADLRVLTTLPIELDAGHYAGLFAAENVPVRQATQQQVSLGAVQSISWHLLRSVPEGIQAQVASLVYELLANRPDVLHCWLDQPNVIGALAGLMAAVPHIILSLRNVNPTHFPSFCEDYFQPWYQLVVQSNRVHMISNSHSGATSYAEWIGVPVERIHVVFNGVCFDHFPQPTPALRQQARASFGLSAEDRVVCGVFRLAAEKQPELFLDVVRKVAEHVPNFRVLLAGVGDLEGRVKEIVRATGLEQCVKLLGRRSDVATVFLASDASLLTSSHEGCPNVALESQYLGVPIVATASGGTTDAVWNGTTGFLAGVTDAEGLAQALTRVLLDQGLRKRLSAAGPEFVQQRFGLEQMVDQTQAVYKAVRTPAHNRRRVLPRGAELVSQVA